MTNGTFSSRASVCASSVLPEPVGPISRMLDLASSTSSFLRQVLEPLVVVVDRDREDLLRLVLADHVLVEDAADLVRRRQVGLGALAALVGGGLLADDVVAQLDALVADEHRRAGDQLPHLVLALAAEGAVEQLLARAATFPTCATPWSPCERHASQTLSTRPYFTASSAPMKLSRSVSRSMRLDRLAGVLGQDLVQALAQVQDFLGVDLDVRGLALEAAHRLVDHDARVGQAEALALGARGQQQRAHAGRLADAQRATRPA